MVYALLIAIVHALGSDPGEVLSIHVFGEKPVDVALVARDVLALQFVSGASHPGRSVLDFVEVGHSLRGVHPVKLYNFAIKTQTLSLTAPPKLAD